MEKENEFSGAASEVKWKLKNNENLQKTKIHNQLNNEATCIPNVLFEVSNR